MIVAAEAIYAPPYYPYTVALLSVVPIPDPEAVRKHIRLSGTVPNTLNPPSGCRFHTRCPRRENMLSDRGKICETVSPRWCDEEGHRILCHIPLDDLKSIEPVFHSDLS